MEKLKFKVVDTASEPTKIESNKTGSGYLLFLFRVTIRYLLVNERGWNRLCNNHEDTLITSAVHYRYLSWKKLKYQGCLLSVLNFCMQRYGIAASREVPLCIISSFIQVPYFS